MRYDQIIYIRLLSGILSFLQVTCGCSYNQCAFCNMYKTVDFEVIPLKQIIADLRMLPATILTPSVFFWSEENHSVCLLSR